MAQLGSARLSSARLGSARLGSAKLGSARLSSARLHPANSARGVWSPDFYGGSLVSCGGSPVSYGSVITALVVWVRF